MAKNTTKRTGTGGTGGKAEDKVGSPKSGTRFGPELRQDLIFSTQQIDTAYFEGIEGATFEIGEPIFEVPPDLTDALAKALSATYGDSEGRNAFVEILDKLNEGLADWGASVDTLNAAISNATAATSTFNDLFLAFELSRGEKLKELGEGFEAFTSSVSKLDLEQLDAVRDTIDDMLDAALKWRKFELSRPKRERSDRGQDSEPHAFNGFGAASGDDLLVGGIGLDDLSGIGRRGVTLTSSHGDPASQWPWSGSSPEIGEARGAIEDLQALLDELGFDWQNTFERMKSVLLDFAETGKFEWRDLAKIALEAIEDMVMRWLDLQQQTMAGSGGTGSGKTKTNWWRVAAEFAYTAASAYFSRGAASGGGATLPAGGVHGPTTGKAAGGPVSAFAPYMVGEKGPELFVPRVPGEIVPNHALARGGSGAPAVNQTIVFNVSPGVPEAVRREVSSMIPAIAQAAKAGVAADMDRNGGLRRRLN